jgi:1-acyl-sn-glycerol-3-phosphate acyltransferase
MAGMKDAPRLYRALRSALPHTLAPWIHLHVEGLEHVPTDRPVIFACNHLSFVDSLVMPMNVKLPLYFLGKADYFDSWKTRWFFSSVGVVPAHREGGSKGQSSLDTGVEILSRGDCIGIYPEGTRSPDGRLYRGKTGPVRMALEAGVDIIPVAVEGTDRAWPTGSYTPNRHPCTVRYGRPLDLSRYSDRRDDPFSLRAATDELMFEIMMLSGQEYVDEYASNVKSGSVDVDRTVVLPEADETITLDGSDADSGTRATG